LSDTIAISGATGFLGKHLTRTLALKGVDVRPLTRKHTEEFANSIAVGDISADTDWRTALKGVACVIHCAGRAHILKETAADPLGEFRKVNRDSVLKLARDAQACGVRRLVFLSSVGVMGTHTNQRRGFSAFDSPHPTWDYAVSKHEAEILLREYCDSSGLELVIVRPPMVYGPGVPANFLRLLQIVQKGVPLPVGSVNNRRSMVGVDNLVDFLHLCALHPKAAGQTFMVCDGQDLSTPELIVALARHLRRPARLLHVPLPLLRLSGRVLGRQHDIERLVGSLQVDIEHTKSVLDWNPPYSVDDGLRKTAEWYLMSREEGVK
jgi:nucleoside-diphosphate-sugar epimerase